MHLTYEALDTLLSEQISRQTININANPFPHFIIDDFLPVDFLDQINSLSIKETTSPRKFFTANEKNKQVYENSTLFGPLYFPMRLLSGNIGKKLVSKIIFSQSVKSMIDDDNYVGFPYHIMQSGGYLGSHVDHSHSGDYWHENDLHVANCIYYASPKWDAAWGGEFLLFNQTGLRIINKITPKPNRLIVFSNSSSSFHGVGRLNCPEHIKRVSYYMDFYIPKSEYLVVKAHLKKTFGVNFSIWRHVTTFIPFAPLGIKSFSLKDFWTKLIYFPSFLSYWLVFLFRPMGQILFFYRVSLKP